MYCYVALCSLHEGRIMSLQHRYRSNRDGNTAFSVMLHYTSSKQSREVGTAARSHSESTWLNRCLYESKQACAAQTT